MESRRRRGFPAGWINLSDRPVVLFLFGGREGNLRINLPLIGRILDENPQVTFHLWNLARLHADSEYIKTVGGDRIKVFNQWSGRDAIRRMSQVWSYYTHERFRDTLFVKMDDDVVFIQTEKFGDFVDAIEANSNAIISAEVVNNGACTPFMPKLRDKISQLGVPLLEVHESNECAQLAHRFMFEEWRDLVDRPISLTEVDLWLSINFIGMDWQMLRRIQAQIGRRSPLRIADRDIKPGSRIGDEGAANMFDRMVMQGFTTAHLGFGPQKLTDHQESEWRQDYDEMASEYLQSVAERNTVAG